VCQLVKIYIKYIHVKGYEAVSMRRKFASILFITLLFLTELPVIHAASTQNGMNTGGDAVGTFSGSPSIVLIVDQIEGTGDLDEEDSDDVFDLSIGFHVEVSVVRAPTNEVPIAEFDMMVDGGTLMLTDISVDGDGEVVKHRWYWDGELLEEYLEEPIILWEDVPEGDYEISLIVVDEQGAESEPYTETVTVVHQVNQPPVASFEWWVGDNKLVVDAGSSTDSDGEIAEYRWYVDGEMMGDSLDWDGWTWESVPAGVYDIVLVVVDDQGAESEPVTATVEVGEILNNPPEAIFSWQLEGGTLIVDGSGSSDDGGIVYYRWFVDGLEDVSLGGLASWEWANIEAGFYEITLYVYDEGGEEGMYRGTVLIGDGGREIPGFPILSLLSGLILSIIFLRKSGFSRNGVSIIPS
jgi:PKD repeat protein